MWYIFLNITNYCRDKIMDLNTNTTFLRTGERKIRADNIIYMPENLDFYVTTYSSYKRFF